MDTLAVLGQSLAPAGALTGLVVVGPPYTGVAVSTLTACNESNSQPAKIRISVAIAAATDDPSQYIVYDLTLQPNETRSFTIGVTMAQTDVIRVQSDTGNVAFSAFGVQIQP